MSDGTQIVNFTFSEILSLLFSFRYLQIFIPGCRETLEENIDKIPENSDMMEVVDKMAEMVPSEEEIHSGLDMIVEQ